MSLVKATQSPFNTSALARSFASPTPMPRPGPLLRHRPAGAVCARPKGKWAEPLQSFPLDLIPQPTHARTQPTAMSRLLLFNFLEGCHLPRLPTLHRALLTPPVPAEQHRRRGIRPVNGALRHDASFARLQTLLGFTPASFPAACTCAADRASGSELPACAHASSLLAALAMVPRVKATAQGPCTRRPSLQRSCYSPTPCLAARLDHRYLPPHSSQNRHWKLSVPAHPAHPEA